MSLNKTLTLSLIALTSTLVLTGCSSRESVKLVKPVITEVDKASLESNFRQSVREETVRFTEEVNRDFQKHAYEQGRKMFDSLPKPLNHLFNQQ